MKEFKNKYNITVPDDALFLEVPKFVLYQKKSTDYCIKYGWYHFINLDYIKAADGSIKKYLQFAALNKNYITVYCIK